MAYYSVIVFLFIMKLAKIIKHKLDFKKVTWLLSKCYFLKKKKKNLRIKLQVVSFVECLTRIWISCLAVYPEVWAKCDFKIYTWIMKI